MKTSPTGSKILAIYALLFAGVAPAGLCLVALANGVTGISPAGLLLALSIIYCGIRVFLGHYGSVRLFAVLVAVHYFGLTATNLWSQDAFPPGSRAAEMATPRAIRGLLFGAIYVWYYLIRKRTKEGFEDPMVGGSGGD